MNRLIDNLCVVSKDSTEELFLGQMAPIFVRNGGRMNRIEAEKIFYVMEKRGFEGIAIFSLANATQISIHKLHKYLTGYPEFFCRVDKAPKYTINRYGPFRGEKRDMLEEIERMQKRRMQLATFLPIWISLCLGGWVFFA